MCSTILNKISSYFANPLNKNNECSSPLPHSTRRFGQKHSLGQLEKDTLSFSGNKTKPALKGLEYFASELYLMGKRVFPDFEAMCERIFGNCPDPPGVKSINSMENKIPRRLKPDEKLTVRKAIEIVTDLLRTRKITIGSEANTDSYVKKLCEEIKNGTCEITEIRNYRGELNGPEGRPIMPYFSKENISDIVCAQIEAKPKMPESKIKVKESRGKESAGYTATHILGKIKGVPFEIQIKGDKVKTIDEGTHLLHDADIGKLSSNKKVVPQEIKEIMELYKNLSTKMRARYDNYVANCYDQARIAETSKTAMQLPKLPSGIPLELNMSNLIEKAKTHGYT